MHMRMNMLAGDPARLDEATRYIEGTVRPHVEGLHGNRGLACLTNADLGVCAIASYWDTHDAMTASEQAVQVSRKEVVQLLGGTVAVEHYEVPVFVRRSRPQGGAGVRMARFECAPGSVDTLIEEFRNTGVPALMDIPGLCSAHMMVDRATGRCIAVSAWDDMAAMAASRSATAGLRAGAAERTHAEFRSVEEYRLVFSSVREGDTRSLIEHDIELWNARDREGWMAGLDLHRLEVLAPGRPRLTGREAAETIWNTYNEAFPDNRLEIIAIHADDRGGVHEGRATGTHTGTLRGPAGEIAATGRSTDMRFCGVYEIDEGKITSFHLYFDQAELMSQLGLAAGSTPSGMLPADREPGLARRPACQARRADSQITSIAGPQPVARKEDIPMARSRRAPHDQRIGSPNASPRPMTSPSVLQRHSADRSRARLLDATHRLPYNSNCSVATCWRMPWAFPTGSSGPWSLRTRRPRCGRR